MSETNNTRILSWLQMVLNADPGWQQESRRPRVYEFSNGRAFYDPVSNSDPA